MTFERWQSGWDRSWAYWLFKKHHTELNAIYWSHLAASNQIQKTTKSLPPETPTDQIFPILPDDKRRVGATIQRWQNDYKSFNNWVNLNAAVALASYLEIYIQNIVTLAIESDPALLLGVPKAVDGARLLKHQPGYSHAEHGLAVTKGIWQQRANIYKNYFGSLPIALENSINDLDELRQLRNGVAHTFGRTIDTYQQAKTSIDPHPPQKLTPNRLKKWLETVETVVLEIDDHLRTKHIGAYELIHYYNQWLKKNKITTPDPAAFKEHIHARLGIAPNKEYFKALSRYYNDL